MAALSFTRNLRLIITVSLVFVFLLMGTLLFSSLDGRVAASPTANYPSIMTPMPDQNCLVYTSKVIQDVDCDHATGSIDLIITSGTAPYAYNWSGPGGFTATTEDIAGLAPGTYYFTVTDNNSCTGNGSYSVADNVTLPRVSFGIQHFDCIHSGEIDITVTDGNAPYTYNWSNSSTSEDISGLSPGNYTITAVDAGGCSVVETFTILDNTATLEVTITATDATCNSSDGSADLTVTGGSGPYTYAWSNSVTTEDLSGVVSGPYFVTVTDVYGCSVESDILVDEDNSITTQVSMVPDVCDQGIGEVSLTPSGGTAPYTYYWFFDANTNSSRTDLHSGFNAVIVTDDNGCKDYVTFIVGYSSGFTVTNTIQNIDCNNTTGSIDLTVTGAAAPVTYIWSNNATTQDVSGLAAGNYTVTFYDDNGCGEILNFNIEDENLISAIYTSTPATCGNTDGTADLTVTGGVPPYSYLWSNSATTEDLTGVASGPYFVTITDGNGCTIGYDGLVDEDNSIVTQVDIVPDVCGQGVGEANLTPSGGVSPYTYYWFFDGNTNSLRTGLNSGVSPVIITDDNGCKDYVLVIVDYESGFSVSENITHISADNPTGAIDLTVSNFTAPMTYVWSHGPTTEDVTGLATGSYTVTFYDDNGCGEILTYEISQKILWENTANVAQSNNSIYKNAGGSTDNNAGGSSLNRLASGTDGYFQFEVKDQSAPNGTYVGLSRGYTNIGFSDINYGFELSAGTYNFIANGDVVSVNYYYSIGDVFRIERSGSNITYLVNGIPVNNVTVDNTEELFIDVSYKYVTENITNFVTNFQIPFTGNADITFDDPTNSGTGSIALDAIGGVAPYTYLWGDASTGSSLTNLTAGKYTVTITDANSQTVVEEFDLLNDIVWQNVTDVTFGNGTFTKSTGTGWTGGASSTEVFEANQNGSVAFRFNNYGARIAVGLSETDPDVTVASIDYGIYIVDDALSITESGTTTGYGTAHVGDWFRIERYGSKIIYYRNDIELTRTTVDPLEELLIDMSIAQTTGIQYNIYRTSSDIYLDADNQFNGSNHVVCQDLPYTLGITSTTTGFSSAGNEIDIPDGTLSATFSFVNEDFANTLSNVTITAMNPPSGSSTLLVENTDYTISSSAVQNTGTGLWDMVVEITTDATADYYEIDYTYSVPCNEIPTSSADDFFPFPEPTITIGYTPTAPATVFIDNLMPNSMQVYYPYLTYVQGSATTGNISIPFGTGVTNVYEFDYKNTRPAPFTGSIEVIGAIGDESDCFNGLAPPVRAYDDVSYTIEFFDSDDISLNEPGNPFTITDFSTPFNLSDHNIIMEEDYVVRITKTMVATSCMAQTGCDALLQFWWGCKDDPCKKSATNHNVVMGPNVAQPDLRVNRLYPSANGGDAWDASCSDNGISGDDTEWAFIIYNNASLTTGGPAEHVQVRLSGLTDASLSMIDYTTIRIHEPGSDLFQASPTGLGISGITAPTLMPTLDEVSPGSNEYTLPVSPLYGGITEFNPTGKAATGACITNAIEELLLGADEHETGNNITLAPGEGFVITFSTTRCCSSAYTNRVVTDNGYGLDYNRWNIIATSDKPCAETDNGSGPQPVREEGSGYAPGTSLVTAPTIYSVNNFAVPNNNEPATAISTNNNSENTGRGDLYLHQFPIAPNKSFVGDGAVCPAGPTTASHFHPFLIRNDEFLSSANAEDMQLFCPTQTCEPDAQNVGGPDGIVKVIIELPTNIFAYTDIPPTMTSALDGEVWSGTWDQSITGFPTAEFRINDPTNWGSGVSPSGAKFAAFMENSIIEFRLGVCCDNPNSPAQVNVFTDIVPMPQGDDCSDECGIPLSMVTFEVTTQCPGCVTPGFIVEVPDPSQVYRLERITLGFADADNNGIAEANTAGDGPQPIDGTYSPQGFMNDPLVDRSIVGDVLIMEYFASLQTGSPVAGAGFDITQWNNAQSDNPIRYMIFEQMVDNAMPAPPAGSGYVGFENNLNNEFTLAYSSGGPNTDETYTLTPYTVTPTTVAGATGVTTYYTYVFDLQEIENMVGSPPYDNAVFNIEDLSGGDWFRLRTEYRICGSPAKETPLNPVGFLALSPLNPDNFPQGTAVLGNTDNEMFHAPVRENHPILPDYIQISGVAPDFIPSFLEPADFLDPDGLLGGPAINGGGSGDRPLWVCSSPVGNHTVFPVTVSRTFDPTGVLDDGYNPVGAFNQFINSTYSTNGYLGNCGFRRSSCTKPGNLEIEIKIGDGDGRVFPYEVRMVPNLGVDPTAFISNSYVGPEPDLFFNLNVPFDYTASAVKLYTAARDSRQSYNNQNYLVSIVEPTTSNSPIITTNPTVQSGQNYSEILQTRLDYTNAEFVVLTESGVGGADLYQSHPPLDQNQNPTRVPEQYFEDPNNSNSPVLLMGDELFVVGVDYELYFSSCSQDPVVYPTSRTISDNDAFASVPSESIFCNSSAPPQVVNSASDFTLFVPDQEWINPCNSNPKFTQASNNGVITAHYSGNTVRYSFSFTIARAVENTIVYISQDDLDAMGLQVDRIELFNYQPNFTGFIRYDLPELTQSPVNINGEDFIVFDADNLGDDYGPKYSFNVFLEYVNCNGVNSPLYSTNAQLPVYIDWNCTDLASSTNPIEEALNSCSNAEIVWLDVTPARYQVTSNSTTTNVNGSALADNEITGCVDDVIRLTAELVNDERGGVGQVRCTIVVPQQYYVLDDEFYITVPGLNINVSASNPVNLCPLPAHVLESRTLLSNNDVEYVFDLSGYTDFMDVYGCTNNPINCSTTVQGTGCSGEPGLLVDEDLGLSTITWGGFNGQNPRPNATNSLQITFDARIVGGCENGWFGQAPTYQFEYIRFCDPVNTQRTPSAGPAIFEGTEDGFEIIGNNCITVTNPPSATYGCDLATTGLPDITFEVSSNAPADATYTWSVTCASCSTSTLPVDVAVSPGSSVTVTAPTISSVNNGDKFTFTIAESAPNGCTTEYEITAGGVSVSLNVDNDCTDGSIFITPNDPGTYSYSWSEASSSFSSTSPELIDEAAGVYTVIVTETATGCTGTATAAIEPSTIDLIVEDIDCLNSQPASATATVNGNDGPYTYLWSTTSTNQTITGLLPGTNYFVTVTSADGTCSISNNPANPVTVTETNLGTIGFDVSQPPGPTCIGASDGQVAAVIMNPATGITTLGTNYFYSWNPTGLSQSGTGGSIISNLGAGTYNVTATFGSQTLGLCATAGSITFNDPDGLVVIMSHQDITCVGANDGTISISRVSGGSGIQSAFRYSLNTGAQSANGQFTGLSAGTYTVTITDANGCEYTQDINAVPFTFTIDEPQNTFVTAVSMTVTSEPTCFGNDDGVITVNVTNPGTNTSYHLEWGNNFIDQSNNNVFTNLEAGEYDITVTDITSGDCALATITMDEPEILAGTLAVTPPDCEGGLDGSVDASDIEGGTPFAVPQAAPFAYTYDWEPDGYTGDGTPEYSGLPGGFQGYVTITDAAGCSIVKPFTVPDQNGSLTLTVQHTDPTCFGADDGTITVLPPNPSGDPYAYSINGGSTFQTSNVFTGLSPATYTVILQQDMDNCYADVVEIEESLLLTVSSVTSECNGQPTGSITIVGYGGNPHTINGYDYSIDGTSYQTDNVFYNVAPGTYDVYVRDVSGCIATDQIVVDPVTAFGSDVETCAGESVAIGSTAVSGYTYTWSDGSLSGSNPTVSPSSTTTYGLTVDDGNGCTITTEIEVDVLSHTLTAYAGNDVAINSGNNHTLGLGSSINTTALGGDSPYTYEWSPTTGLSHGSVSPPEDAADPIAAPTSTTTYTVTVTDANGCTATDDIIVTINSGCSLTANAGANTTICPGGSYTLGGTPTASNGTPSYSYTWTVASGPAPGTTLSGANPSVTPTETTVYDLVVTDGGGCIATSSVEVAVVAADAGSDVIICGGESVQLGAPPVSGYLYEWSGGAPGSLSNPGISNPIATPTVTTTYTLKAVHANGCTVYDYVEVVVSGNGTAFSFKVGSPIPSGANEIDGFNIKTNANEDVFVSGSFKGYIDFGGGDTRTHMTRENDVFVARYDACGALNWVDQIYSNPLSANATGADFIIDIEVNDNDDVYVLGTFKGNLYTGFSSIPLNTSYVSNNTQTYLIKYNGSGVEQWVRIISSPAGSVYANDMKLDDSGNPIIVGLHTNDLNAWNGLPGSGSTLESYTATPNTSGAYLRNGFIAKYNSSGTAQWIRGYGGSDTYDWLQALDIRSGTNTIVALETYKDLSANYRKRIVEFDANGQNPVVQMDDLEFTPSISAPREAIYEDRIVLNSSGDVILMGYTNVGGATYAGSNSVTFSANSTYLLKFDSNWDQVGNYEMQYLWGRGLTIGASDDIAVTGIFDEDNDIYFNSTAYSTNPNPVGYNVDFAFFNLNSNLSSTGEWILTAGNNLGETVGQPNYNSTTGKYYLTGGYYKKVDLSSITLSGGLDMYIARVDESLGYGQFQKEIYQDISEVVEQDFEFVLHPNPSNGKITIDYDLGVADADFVLYDLSGHEVYRKTLRFEEQNTTIDLGLFDSGMYLYRVLQGDLQLKTDKLVIVQ